MENLAEKPESKLLDQLKHHDSLHFAAKKNLLAQLNLHPELFHQASESQLAQLKEAIDFEMKLIQNLDYLHDLGYQAVCQDGQFQINRLKSALVIDFVGAFISILLLLALASSLYLWGAFFQSTEQESIHFLGLSVLSGIGFVGVFLSYICFERIFANLGYKVIRTSDQIIVKRRYQLKLKMHEMSFPKQFIVVESSTGLALIAQNHNESITLIEVKGKDLKARETLRYLGIKLYDTW